MLVVVLVSRQFHPRALMMVRHRSSHARRVDGILPGVCNLQRPLVDIGCGLGTNALHAVSKGARVVAIDFEEGHLSTIREKAGEALVASGQLQTRCVGRWVCWWDSADWFARSVGWPATQI